MEYRKLKYIPYGNCYTIESEKAVYLISYNSCVLFIDKSTNELVMRDEMLDNTFDYSMTTIHHASAFLKEYTNIDYYKMKRLYKKGESRICLK